MKNITILVLSCLMAFNNICFSQTEFWGMTYLGGSDGIGTIFKTDSDGNNHSVEYNFPRVNVSGAYDNLIQANNGKFYGLTRSGGNNNGTLFEYDESTNTHSVKINFDGANNGKSPWGGLMLANNGKLYGMTSDGGVNNEGVMFEYDVTSGVMTKLIDFDGVNKGSTPKGNLIQATNGKLYGMTTYGGALGRGIIFEYDLTNNTFTNKEEFDLAYSGSHPIGELMQASNGKLYGMTNDGGFNNNGILFEYDLTNDTLIKKVDFDGANNGKNPNGSLMQANNGKLYGTTSFGGANNEGVLFEYDITSDTLINKIDFDNINKGRNPHSTLFETSNGMFYGVTVQGGTNDNGVLFKYNEPTNTLTKMIDFSNSSGNSPYGSLIQATNGKLYGLTSSGSLFQGGTIFEYDANADIFTTKVVFKKADNGAQPRGHLEQASNGKLYGITVYGGTNNKGILFEFNKTNNSFINKFNFNYNDGYAPKKIILASNNKIYGIANGGNINGKGVLFEYDLNTNIYTKKVDFNNTIGAYPSDIIQATNGKLYGLTGGGGVNNNGVLFEYDFINDTYTKIDIDTAVGIAASSLIQASNGKIYGATVLGGAYNSGAIFEFDIALNTITEKADFDDANTGKKPFAKIMEASNNKIYGLTEVGGANNDGVLFEFDYSTSILTKKVDFDEINKGKYPDNGLFQASNGKLYGTASNGGVNGTGTMYEYDINTNIFTKKVDFNGANGATPSYNIITEINTIIPCYDPTNLSATNITFYSATLNWQENGSATNWDIEIGAQGFSPTGTPTNNDINMPFAWSNGTANTSYDYYVRADCGSNNTDTSVWVGPYSFTTLQHSCNNPTNLTALNILQTTATLDWQENGSATTWDVEIGFQGFSPTGTPSENNISKPFAWTTGTANTSYDYYVRADCDANNTDISAWVGPFSFTTLQQQNCNNPTNLTALNILQTTATLDWQENGSATTWDVEIGFQGFSPLGTPSENNISKPFAWTNGTANTSYDFYVRADCDANNTDISAWVGPFDFKTSNSSVAISELKNKLKVILFPNPTTGIVNISVNENLKSIVLLDITGKQIKSFDSNATQLDVSDVSSGIYFLEVANESKNFIVKLIIR